MTDGAALPIALSDLVHALRVGGRHRRHRHRRPCLRRRPRGGVGPQRPGRRPAPRRRRGGGGRAWVPAWSAPARRSAPPRSRAPRSSTPPPRSAARPVLCVRMSDGDARERHQGASHHTSTVLDLVRAPTAWPRRRPPTWRSCPTLRPILEALGVTVTTMGRGPAEDPAFFEACASAAAVAADMLPPESPERSRPTRSIVAGGAQPFGAATVPLAHAHVALERDDAAAHRARAAGGASRATARPTRPSAPTSPATRTSCARSASRSMSIDLTDVDPPEVRLPHPPVQLRAPRPRARPRGDRRRSSWPCRSSASRAGRRRRALEGRRRRRRDAPAPGRRAPRRSAAGRALRRRRRATHHHLPLPRASRARSSPTGSTSPGDAGTSLARDRDKDDERQFRLDRIDDVPDGARRRGASRRRSDEVLGAVPDPWSSRRPRP